MFADRKTLIRIMAVGWAVWLTCSGSPATADEEINFNRDIRPILSENCFFCHGQDEKQRQASLRLDQRESALESESIVPGDPANSPLIERTHSDDADLLMPPPDSNRSLTDRQRGLLKRWVEQGAPYQQHWAFETPERPQPPAVKRSDWIRNPIDSFVLAKLESSGLEPSPEADRNKLIRRLSIDLTGLPPTSAEVQQFVTDTDPQAYEKLVDRLMASPHYGERLALPWLDAARYSDSNGFQQDGDTFQWVWRDWVVRALNDDLPFDQFTIWQLAGDLLPEATTDQKIASGFNRNHMLNGEGGAIAEEQRFVNMFDRIDTTSTTWLGLTMACAQCHDHKYDPVTQRDYYSLMDAFNRVPETGTPQYQSSRIRVAAPFIEVPTEQNHAAIVEFESKLAEARAAAKPLVDAAYAGWKAGFQPDDPFRQSLSEPVRTVLAKPAGERNEKEKKELEAGFRKYFDQKVQPGLKNEIPQLKVPDTIQGQLSAYRADKVPKVMVMSDAKPRKTSILDRGQYLQPTDPVTFATPGFLLPMPEGAPANRLGFAQWLVSDDHPLTARVQVNRMWQYFFGMGIVKTTEDLGVQSEYPIHKELLDWLAVEFRETGWSMKKLHRLIVTSATYRQSSRMSEQHRQQDPENRLYARASRFRMPATVLRDWALSSAGLLVDTIGGAPVYPYQPDNVWEPLAITKERDFTYPASSGDDLYRRSLYTFWRRTVGPANMFDASNRQACRVRATPTSTPLHALTTLNDPTWVEAARNMAQSLMGQDLQVEPRMTAAFQQALSRKPGENELARLVKIGRLTAAFQQVLSRDPSEQELARLVAAYRRQVEIYSRDPESAMQLLTIGESKFDEALDPVKTAALSAVCLGILNLDEALTRE